MEHSIPPEISQMSAYRLAMDAMYEKRNEELIPGYKTPISMTFEREQWYEYYADGKRVYTCPGCNRLLASGEPLQAVRA